MEPILQATKPGEKSWRKNWPPTIGLGTKVGVLVVVGTVTMIGLFAYLGTTALSENTERTLQERVILAQMTGSYVDALLDNIQNVLTDAADDAGWFTPTHTDLALEQAYRRLSFFASRVFLVDKNGHSVASAPPLAGTTSFAEITPVTSALNGNSFAVSPVAQPLGTLGPQAVAAAPVRDTDGNIIGALAITLNFSNPNLRAFSNPIGLGETGYMDLVALDGRILASTRPSRIASESDHGYSLSGMIRDHRQAVSACHDCHVPANTTPSAVATSETPLVPEVLAFAPLNNAQWGITVRQSEAEVFAPTRLLQSRVFELMVIMLGGALVIVYVATRTVIVPVQGLTAATRRIASGDLETPIPHQGRDEMGVLARSFDEMRVRLKQSSEEIQALNRDLDARVRERTTAYQAAAQENARLYAELQLKEQMRGELLHRVISVQEDERKRIARELHDETSQGLTALMVGLDTVRMALAQDVEKANTRLRNCNSIAETLLKNIHRLIADLRPTLLDDLGLVPAIEWYGEQRLKPLGITLELDQTSLKSLKGRLPPSIETALFRIVQEAITNIVRHAQARVVTVRLARLDKCVILQIADDGQGFEPQLLQLFDPHGKGLGLRGMQERTSILGGEFDLQTAPGRGTIISVRVPMPD